MASVQKEFANGIEFVASGWPSSRRENISSEKR
jgi:hypothetical protein